MDSWHELPSVSKSEADTARHVTRELCHAWQICGTITRAYVQVCGTSCRASRNRRLILPWISTKYHELYHLSLTDRLLFVARLPERVEIRGRHCEACHSWDMSRATDLWDHYWCICRSSWHELPSVSTPEADTARHVTRESCHAR